MPRRSECSVGWAGGARDGGLLSTPGIPQGVRATALAGYTLIELLMVMLLAALLLGMGVNGLNRASAQRNVKGARDTFVWLARRAQATAVQRGSKVRLVLYPDSARARVTAPGRPDEVVYFYKEYRTTVSAGGVDSVSVTYDPRGFANPQITPVTVVFRQAQDSAVAVVQALGQVDAQ